MAESNGYTKFPNWLLDEAMPKCSYAEWAILCVIARKTVGWGNDCERISINDFMKLTGIEGRQHVVSAINRLLEKGYISRESDGQWFNYSLRSSNLELLVTLSNQLPKVTASSNLELPEVVTKSNQFTPVLKKERKLKKNIYAPTALNGNGKRYESSHFEKLLPCLVKAVKTPYGAGVNEDEFEQAIYTLIGWDVTPEQVEGFGEWWKTNGHYKGLPALKSFVAEFRNYLSGVKTNQGNGKPPDNTTWQRIVTAVTNGVFTGLSSEEKTALRSIGGLPVIKAMTPYDEPKLKSQFFQALGTAT